MTVWLVGLALFNISAVASLFVPRSRRRNRVPWLLFAVSLLASELAWLWLPVQATLVLAFSLGGALENPVGGFALGALVLSWPVLVWSLRTGLACGPLVEHALQGGLGEGYRAEVPLALQQGWRQRTVVRDWRNPVRFSHPDVELIRNVAYGPAGVRQMLDIYRPKTIPPGGCPVILQIHGGAWILGDKAHQADVAAAIDDLCAVARQDGAGGAGRLRPGRIPAEAGAAEDADGKGFGHDSPAWLGPGWAARPM